MNKNQVHYGTCHLCETMCGIAVEHDGEKILSIKGDEKHPLSKGKICPKATGLQDVYNDPDRLRMPVKKVSGEFVEISWEEAFETVGKKLADIQNKYGLDAVGSVVGRQIAHSFQSLLMIGPTRGLVGSKNIYSGSSVDQLPHNFVYYFMFGHQQLVTVPDIERTDYMLILGANPAVSNGGMMCAGANTKFLLKEIVDRGGQVVLIDPRRNETLKYASEHLFIYPGMDALFLLGVVQTIFAKDLATPGKLDGHITGWEQVRQLANSFDIDEIAEATGISRETIERIATDFAQAQSAICFGRTGTSMQEFGALAQWLIQVVNVITGNMDEPGGMMFSTPAFPNPPRFSKGSWDRHRSRVSGRPEFFSELPVAVMAEEIFTPGTGQIRAMIASGGNPVLSMPNGKLLEDAFAQLDFMVSIGPYIDESSRLADIILPPISIFERSHYDMYYKIYNVRDYAKYTAPLFPPKADEHSYTDFEIMRDLLGSLCYHRARNPLKRFLIKGLHTFIRRCVKPEWILKTGLRFGPYGPGLNPFKKGVTLQYLKDNPHGVDLGPLKPQLPGALLTEDKCIHLAPQEMLDDIPRLRKRWLEDEKVLNTEYPLKLISRLQHRTLGWMHNSYRLVKGKTTCTLYMHPQDAEARNICDGEIIRLYSRTGNIQLPLEITDQMMPGVVCMPHLWGHTRSGTRLSVANKQPGASMNDVTDETHMDSLSGTSVVNGVPVEVSKLV